MKGLLPPGSDGPSADLTPVDHSDIACLASAKRRRLVRKTAKGDLDLGGDEPRVGWWCAASWDYRYPDPSQGGPWSVERVARLRELGFLSCSPDEPHYAEITKAGRKRLLAGAPLPSVAAPADGEESREAI